ncbi:MAG: GTPase ObgE [Clostridia bacterium]|nr:GTPase ObgE [Eubacteriales bacterium]MDD3866486.1 GTPase ObgE [Eubacteriales bacterium]MDD4461674.1 GTPase ObgE [Eubacteriales bacterium]NCC48827.1 GTPase ObgE [Clostridia bacterium]
MFIDTVKINVKAGNGGNGMMSFHTEKYVPNGGPDGGDGGNGGNVIFQVDPGMTTLQNFRFKRKFLAEDGEKGGRRKLNGKAGSDLVISVPAGTLVKIAETNEVLADLTEENQQVVIARGGRGGKGNVHFANSVRQAPRFARAGEAGDAYYLQLELKLLADVGLLGFPNVGKSTLLSVISAARPKIADYHFTTIEPNLGVVAVGDFSFVVADIPGLIAGAHEGQGLGLQFLRHIERTRLLIHVIDASGSEGRDPIDDFTQINHELAAYDMNLSERPQIIALNKTDLAEPDQLARLHAHFASLDLAVYEICAPIAEGTTELIQAVAARVRELPRPLSFQPIRETAHYRYEEKELFQVVRDDRVFHVEGEWVINLVESTNFEDHESAQYFQRLIRRKGIVDALEAAGIEEGDQVIMHDLAFDYIR